jgi:tetratricopeptide (TPR) repeat protein
MNTLDKYLFQAIDAYPYDLEETVESLNYALSYNPENTKALCLMGQVYAEQLKDYETAKNYFQDAISENIHAIDVYSHYINTLMWNEDFEEAEKLINFAFTIKGIDKALMLLKKAQLFEIKIKYKIALKHIKKAKEFTYNSEFISYLDREKRRIKSKMSKKEK